METSLIIALVAIIILGGLYIQAKLSLRKSRARTDEVQKTLSIFREKTIILSFLLDGPDYPYSNLADIVNYAPELIHDNSEYIRKYFSDVVKGCVKDSQDGGHMSGLVSCVVGIKKANDLDVYTLLEKMMESVFSSLSNDDLATLLKNIIMFKVNPIESEIYLKGHKLIEGYLLQVIQKKTAEVEINKILSIFDKQIKELVTVQAKLAEQMEGAISAQTEEESVALIKAEVVKLLQKIEKYKARK